MKVIYHGSFEKAYKKRVAKNAKLVARARERTKLFVADPGNSVLKDHALTGSLRGYRAFWISGDMRIVYKRISEIEVVFVDIGTHNQVY